MNTPLELIRPTSPAEALALHASTPHAEYKAGGTDVMDRVHASVLAPSVAIDLARAGIPNGIALDGDTLVIGAGATLRAMAAHASVLEHARVVAAAADHTATPQIRAMATLGGALFQRPRCVYLRDEAQQCLKKGGPTCLARAGDTTWHAILEPRGCVAVHPSTVAAALMAVDAQADVLRPGADAPVRMSVESIFTLPAEDSHGEHALPPGSLVLAVRIPSRRAWRHGYERASARLLADWADVEVAVALDVRGDVITDARVVLGAVARTPRRATSVESLLRNRPFHADTLRNAAALAADGATALSHNAYKIALARGCVLAALEKTAP